MNKIVDTVMERKKNSNKVYEGEWQCQMKSFLTLLEINALSVEEKARLWKFRNKQENVRQHSTAHFRMSSSFQ